MQKLISSFVLVFFLSYSPLFSQECSLSENIFNIQKTQKQHSYDNPSIMFRIAKISLWGKYSLENLETYITKSVDDIEQYGWEFSIVGGVSRDEGFDFRPMVTFQWFDITKSGDNMASNMSLLGEFEFAYNFNKYFSPFVGFNAGVGITNFNDEVTDAGYGGQFSILTGFSGLIYEHLGYYIKISATKKTSYFSHEEVNHYMSSDLLSLKYGLSYKF